MSGTNLSALEIATQIPLPPSTESLAIAANSTETPQSSRRVPETFLVGTEDDAYGNDRRANESSLPPVDRGTKAWTFALRILGIAIAAVLVSSLPFVNGRLPDLRNRVRGPGPRGLATRNTSIRERDWLKNTTFWVLVTANTFQGFGYFVPILWLPSE
ncbi:hypothetical protein AAF712_003835 [Marasmius tenuissimus]|uniref:Uncharacterized protein n=1 Tax=Marasmius tenuissimus TaxID=585030 RepID=A0ABR3A760_9AGAR